MREFLQTRKHIKSKNSRNMIVIIGKVCYPYTEVKSEWTNG